MFKQKTSLVIWSQSLDSYSFLYYLGIRFMVSLAESIYFPVEPIDEYIHAIFLPYSSLLVILSICENNFAQIAQHNNQ